jgi:hypothetical protein
MRAIMVVLMIACGLAIAAPAAADDGQPTGRSGFWTSNQPAKNGAYRWRLLAIAGGLLCVTGGGMVWLVRRARPR